MDVVKDFQLLAVTGSFTSLLLNGTIYLLSIGCHTFDFTLTGLCDRVWCWRTSWDWHGLRVNPHAAGIHTARHHQESGSELRGQALPGAVSRGGGLLLGRGRGWEIGTWKSQV